VTCGIRMSVRPMFAGTASICYQSCGVREREQFLVSCNPMIIRRQSDLKLVVAWVKSEALLLDESQSLSTTRLPVRCLL
jgi:hypothetical protein